MTQPATTTPGRATTPVGGGGLAAGVQHNKGRYDLKANGKKKTSERATLAAGLFDELICDNFAGGGGASLGIERAFGRAVDVAINHSREAVSLHQTNHPATIHYCEDVWSVDPADATGGRPVGLAWFSPDCRHFSRAKGGKPVQKKVRGLAWVVVRWAAKVKPRVIMLENVREFETWGPINPDGTPCPKRKGKTFKRWVSTLRNLGYEVEWKTLNAADFGSPTHRRRLFLVARCDGQPIAWPEPSHGPGRKPYGTAASCIDWSLPCPSIFLTKEQGRLVGVNRPLAEKTMRRIAMGLKRYVVENPRPFIVGVGGRAGQSPATSAASPLGTITAKNDRAIAVPYFTAQFGEREGQDPRTHQVDEPFPTVTPRAGGGFPLVSAFLGAHYGDRPNGTVREGSHLSSPHPTVTAGGKHSVLTVAHLTKFYGTATGSELDAPLPTVTGQGQHIGDVRAFLTKYFGTGGNGQSCIDPLHTVTSHDRFGLVKVAGCDYRIVDIGLRMLTPRELFRAQGFPDDYVIAPIVDGRPLPKSQQVRLCGNSVCPQVSEALVRANFPDECSKSTPARKSKRSLLAGVAS